jgi:serine/threonine-protein kinase RsbW
VHDVLVITSELERIREARGWLTRHAENEGIPVGVVWEIELAVGEALSNVIRHGYSGQANLKIELRLTIDEEKLELEIHDTARPFARNSVPPPPLGTASTGGYGLHLIDELMDEVEYARREDGGLLRMVKRRYA